MAQGTMTGWLRPSQKAAKVRFIAMMESGELVDEMADVVQTQVIVNRARASIRNRDAVALHYQLEEDAAPVWRENAIVETGLANPPGMESRHVIEDAHNLHMGYQTGTVDSGGGLRLETKHLGIIALGVAVVIFMLMAWLTSLNLKPQEVAAGGESNIESAGGVTAAETDVDNSHGIILEEAETDDRPPDPGEAAVPVGTGPAGAVAQEPVAPGDGQDSPEP